MIETAFAQSVGFIPAGTPATTTQSLNAASNFIAYAFVAQANTSLSATRAFQSGALGGTGGVPACTLQSDGSGAPSGTVIDTLAVGALAGSSWIVATGGTAALTKGAKYWVVWSNTDAAPATNFLKLTCLNNGANSTVTGDDAATSVNSGSAWTQKNCGGGARFDFADGTYLGSPISSALPLIGTQGTYAANEAGVRFTTPAGGSLIVRGLGMFLTKSGTPTGNPFFKIYDAAHTLLGSTFQVSNADAITNLIQWYHRNFDPTTVAGGAATITLAPSTTYTITTAESTQSDTSTNEFRIYGYTWDPDANSLALAPWGAQADMFNGGAWSQTPGLISPFALLLQSGGEFAAAGSPLCISRRQLVTMRGAAFRRRGVLPIAGATPAQAIIPLTRFRPSRPRPPSERRRTVFLTGPATTTQVLVPITRRRLVGSRPQQVARRRQPVITSAGAVQQVLVHRPILVR
jgi:hypothetical protein